MKYRSLVFFLIVLAVLSLAACSGTYALLSGFGAYLDLSMLEEGDLRLVFLSNVRLMNFAVIEIGYDDGFYTAREVIIQKELLPDRPIVAAWTEQERPYRGITFMCEDFETRYFILERAGDALLLAEINK